MEKDEIIKNIEDLFIKWYNAIMFDSTGRIGHDEKAELITYCEKHIEEFKEFAKDTLEHPQECCFHVANLCDELLPGDIVDNQPINIKNVFSKFVNIINSGISGEAMVFMGCNKWLNYFNNTENVDYYKDYVKYKEYLSKHYLPWSPFKESDPNPTYAEYLENKEKYKI